MNFIWRIAFGILVLGLLAPASVSAAEKVRHATPVDGVYTGAITIDAATGAVLFEDNADGPNPPASMTKLMTFAVLHDKLTAGALTLQTPVPITVADSKMGGTQVYLDPRETFPVEELIYAMMIQSANDAAHALARAAGGSTEAFVELMNAKAQALGMKHTTFRSPHGLPPPSRREAEGDMTTPRDFALLCRYLVQNTDVLKYTSVRERKFGTGRANGPQDMHNHNNLLGKIPGVDGLKTGYTQSAGYCLSATAERNGRRIITVIMGSFGPGRQIDKGRARDLKAVELIERGFAAVPAGAPPFKSAVPSPAVPPAKSGEVPTVKTEKAEQSSTPVEPMFKVPVLTPQKKP